MFPGHISNQGSGSHFFSQGDNTFTINANAGDQNRSNLTNGNNYSGHIYQTEASHFTEGSHDQLFSPPSSDYASFAGHLAAPYQQSHVPSFIIGFPSAMQLTEMGNSSSTSMNATNGGGGHHPVTMNNGAENAFVKVGEGLTSPPAQAFSVSQPYVLDNQCVTGKAPALSQIHVFTLGTNSGSSAGTASPYSLTSPIHGRTPSSNASMAPHRSALVADASSPSAHSSGSGSAVTGVSKGAEKPSTRSGGGGVAAAVAPQSKTNLHVLQIPPEMDEKRMTALFSIFGTVTSLLIKRNIHTGESLGDGFVRFQTHEEAKTALETINGFVKAWHSRCHETSRAQQPLVPAAPAPGKGSHGGSRGAPVILSASAAAVKLAEVPLSGADSASSPAALARAFFAALAHEVATVNASAGRPITRAIARQRERYVLNLSLQWAKQQHDATPAGSDRHRLKKLFVRNIPVSEATEERLTHFFSTFGAVKTVTIHRDTLAGSLANPSAGSSAARAGVTGSTLTTTPAALGACATPTDERRIAFVTFVHEGVAEKAANAVHNTQPFPSCHGFPIMVKVAEDAPVKHTRANATAEATAAAGAERERTQSIHNHSNLMGGSPRHQGGGTEKAPVMTVVVGGKVAPPTFHIDPSHKGEASTLSATPYPAPVRARSASTVGGGSNPFDSPQRFTPPQPQPQAPPPTYSQVFSLGTPSSPIPLDVAHSPLSSLASVQLTAMMKSPLGSTIPDAGAAPSTEGLSTTEVTNTFGATSYTTGLLSPMSGVSQLAASPPLAASTTSIRMGPTKKATNVGDSGVDNDKRSHSDFPHYQGMFHTLSALNHTSTLSPHPQGGVAPPAYHNLGSSATPAALGVLPPQDSPGSANRTLSSTSGSGGTDMCSGGASTQAFVTPPLSSTRLSQQSQQQQEQLEQEEAHGQPVVERLVGATGVFSAGGVSSVCDRVAGSYFQLPTSSSVSTTRPPQGDGSSGATQTASVLPPPCLSSGGGGPSFSAANLSVSNAALPRPASCGSSLASSGLASMTPPSAVSGGNLGVLPNRSMVHYGGPAQGWVPVHVALSTAASSSSQGFPNTGASSSIHSTSSSSRMFSRNVSECFSGGNQSRHPGSVTTSFAEAATSQSTLASNDQVPASSMLNLSLPAPAYSAHHPGTNLINVPPVRSSSVSTASSSAVQATASEATRATYDSGYYGSTPQSSVSSLAQGHGVQLRLLSQSPPAARRDGTQSPQSAPIAALDQAQVTQLLLAFRGGLTQQSLANVTALELANQVQGSGEALRASPQPVSLAPMPHRPSYQHAVAKGAGNLNSNSSAIPDDEGYSTGASSSAAASSTLQQGARPNFSFAGLTASILSLPDSIANHNGSVNYSGASAVVGGNQAAMAQAAAAAAAVAAAASATPSGGNGSPSTAHHPHSRYPLCGPAGTFSVSGGPQTAAASHDFFGSSHRTTNRAFANYDSTQNSNPLFAGDDDDLSRFGSATPTSTTTSEFSSPRLSHAGAVGLGAGSGTGTLSEHPLPLAYPQSVMSRSSHLSATTASSPTASSIAAGAVEGETVPSDVPTTPPPSSAHLAHAALSSAETSSAVPAVTEGTPATTFAHPTDVSLGLPQEESSSDDGSMSLADEDVHRLLNLFNDQALRQDVQQGQCSPPEDLAP